MSQSEAHWTNEEWYRESHRRLSLVVKYFKTKSGKSNLREIRTIADFIETAKDVSREEKEAEA